MIIHGNISEVCLFDWFLTQLICQPTGLAFTFFSFFSIPVLRVSIYEHSYGADIARMTVGDEMSLDYLASPLLRFLIGTFLIISLFCKSWFILSSVTITCSPPSLAVQPMPGLSSQTHIHAHTQNPLQTCHSHSCQCTDEGPPVVLPYLTSHPHHTNRHTHYTYTHHLSKVVSVSITPVTICKPPWTINVEMCAPWLPG